MYGFREGSSAFSSLARVIGRFISQEGNMDSIKAKQIAVKQLRKQIPKTVKRMDKEVMFQAKKGQSRAIFQKKQQYAKSIDLVYKYYDLQGFIIIHANNSFILRWD